MQTIKLNSLDRWKPAAGKLLVFEGRGARRIRLHVNSPGVTLAWLVQDEGDLQFLARVDGFQTLEFYAEGNVKVNLDGGDVWWMCAESEPTFIEVADPIIFTKLADRRHRNPELEEVMYRMQLNVERRLAQQADEFAAAFERRRKEIQNEVNDAGAAASASGAPEAEQEPEPAEPGQEAGGGAGGEQPGG